MENEKSLLEKEQSKPWAETERIRPPWVANKHGEHVKPQNEQKSNNNLTNEQVLQPRDEKVSESSTAKPLSDIHSSGDDPAGSKRNLPSNFSRIT